MMPEAQSISVILYIIAVGIIAVATYELFKEVAILALVILVIAGGLVAAEVCKQMGSLLPLPLVGFVVGALSIPLFLIHELSHATEKIQTLEEKVRQLRLSSQFMTPEEDTFMIGDKIFPVTEVNEEESDIEEDKEEKEPPYITPWTACSSCGVLLAEPMPRCPRCDAEFVNYTPRVSVGEKPRNRVKSKRRSKYRLFCSECGKEITDQTTDACPHCGEPFEN